MRQLFERKEKTVSMEQISQQESDILVTVCNSGKYKGFAVK
jgi:hypothetical protein